MAANRRHLKRVIECICFLAKLNLALRGHDETSDSTNKGNFLALIDFRGVDVQEFAESCKRTIAYLAHRTQNQILSIVSLQILEKIKPVSFYSIIADETTDRSKAEQISV